MTFLAYVVKNEIDKQRQQQTSSSDTERTRVRRRSLYKLLLGIGRGNKSSGEFAASNGDREHPPERYAHLATNTQKADHRPLPPHVYSTLDAPENGEDSNKIAEKETSGKYSHLREKEKVKLTEVDGDPEDYSHLMSEPLRDSSFTNPTYLDDEKQNKPTHIYTYIDVELHRGARTLPPTEWRYEGVAPDTTLPSTGLATSDQRSPTELRYEGVAPDTTLPFTGLATSDQGPPTVWRYEGVAPGTLQQGSATITPPTEKKQKDVPYDDQEVAI